MKKRFWCKSGGGWMSGRILLKKGEEHQMLSSSSYENEPKGLQNLLAKYPEIIPGDQINPEAPPSFVLLGREIYVGPGSGSIDLLFVDQNGVLTFVETKLSQKELKDHKGRRAAIGQVLEYSANALGLWEKGEIRERATEFWKRKGKDIDEILQTEFELKDVESFWSEVERNFEQGRIRLIIAADQLYPEMRRVIEFLNSKMEDVEVLGLEISYYEDGEISAFVPRLIGQTQAIVDRKQGGKRQIWNYSTLEEAYEGLMNAGDKIDKLLGKRMLKVLEWAREKGLLIEAKTEYPVLRVRGKSRHIVAFEVKGDGKGNIWVYFEPESRYRDGAEGRDKLIQDLINLGLLQDKPDKSSKVIAKLDQLDEEKLRELLSVFEKYCGD